MKRVIGIVSEGPLDQMVLRTVIDQITGERNIYRYIQPEQDMCGEFGNGWKGVYRWCETNGSLIPALFSQISPHLDLLIIQMDGDVSRKEKEVHCFCKSTECAHSGHTSPLQCNLVKTGECMAMLPCIDHEAGPDGYRVHLTRILRNLLQTDDLRIVITIPCDSTDTWILAAFDEMDHCESIADPWENIISRKKEYHGIRVHGHRKNIPTYREFMKQLKQNWNQVRLRCVSAALFDRAITSLIQT